MWFGNGTNTFSFRRFQSGVVFVNGPNDPNDREKKLSVSLEVSDLRDLRCLPGSSAPPDVHRGIGPLRGFSDPILPAIPAFSQGLSWQFHLDFSANWLHLWLYPVLGWVISLHAPLQDPTCSSPMILMPFFISLSSYSVSGRAPSWSLSFPSTSAIKAA